MFAALLLLVAGAVPARAQDDPPGRVGRLNEVQGSVSFSPAGSDEWVEAGTNRPVTTGDRLWMGRNARSELSIGAAVLRSDEETSVKVLQLDDDQAQFQLSEGTVALHVRNMDPGDRVEIATPNLAFVVDRPGDYRVQVDPDNNITTIAVERGHGTAYADDGQHGLEAPGYARFVGNALDQASGDLPRPDAFDRWVHGRIERAESRPANRYVPRDMVGYEDLDDYGAWSQEPGYGWIWAPRVSVAAWAPYRYGRWVWIAPWGWTWVDDAPWGFAPFHYGRWAYLGSRWCWVPGPVVRRPYYAPALVAFVGSPSVSFTVASGPAVAWFPLSPWDEYRPVYRASPTYVTRINRVVMMERERGGYRPPPGQYVNRYVPGAATALPARAFVEGQPVGREQIRIPEQELRQGRIAGTMPSLAPVRNSLVGQGPRLEPPPVQERERRVVTTRMPPSPAAERDELARRFALSGGQVRGAGPTLAEEPPRRGGHREDRALRLVAPAPAGPQAGDERRPPPLQQGERPGPAGQPPVSRGQERDRGPRIGEPERAPGREASEPPPRFQPPQFERREANRPPETSRPQPEQRQPQRDMTPRGFGPSTEAPVEQGRREPTRPQFERRQLDRPPEAPRAAPFPPQRPDRQEDFAHRQRPPEAEPRTMERPQGPQIGPDRNSLRALRQEESQPRSQAPQREMRAPPQPQPQQAPRNEGRRDDGQRSQKAQQQMERIEQMQRHQGGQD